MHDNESAHVIEQINPIPEGTIDTPEGKIGSAIKAIYQKDRVSLFQDKGYYTTIVFQCREQCEAFMKLTGMENEHGAYWVDGLKLAQKMGIELPQVNTEMLAEAYARKPCISLQPAIARGLKFFDPMKGGEKQ